jgi:uncharacterized membrane protein
MQNFGNEKSALGLDVNIASMLCYLSMICCPIGLIYCIINLAMEKTHNVIRFHAAQSLLILAGVFVINMIFFGLMFILAFADADILVYAVSGIRGIIGLGFLALIIYAAVKANQNEVVRLPVISDLAANMSGYRA